MPPKTGGRGGGKRATATRKSPAVGLAPLPGRSQPTRTTLMDEEDEEMEEGADKSGDDKDKDEDEEVQRKLLEGLEEKGIAGLLMDLVPGEHSNKAFYLIDELVERIARIRTRIEVLEERGPPSKGADFGAL
ncbi:hypothetical protein QBC43DRAFT_294522 [Cladorrhinum sp. PSN259]|nr:hypothetical protein QBC43DRAFT_294522 [Cladorrhinum sp. PSN259]